MPTNLPWAVSFENGLPPTSISTFTEGGSLAFLGYDQDYLKGFLIEGSNTVISVHPTQLYEMTLYILGFLLLRKLKSKRFVALWFNNSWHNFFNKKLLFFSSYLF